MFDKFGKWDYSVTVKNKRHPMLVWEKIKPFEDSNKSYTIVASGHEDMKNIYTSFLVLDESAQDVLIDENEKIKFKNYFTNAIKSDNSKKRDFYEVYWNEVDPERWKLLKTN
jgi:hypothetical protein